MVIFTRTEKQASLPTSWVKVAKHCPKIFIWGSKNLESLKIKIEPEVLKKWPLVFSDFGNFTFPNIILQNQLTALCFFFITFCSIIFVTWVLSYYLQSECLSDHLFPSLFLWNKLKRYLARHSVRIAVCILWNEVARSTVRAVWCSLTYCPKSRFSCCIRRFYGTNQSSATPSCSVASSQDQLSRRGFPGICVCSWLIH